MAIVPVPAEREQGAVQQEEQLAAVAPPPLEPTPTQADEATLANVAQSAVVAQPAQQAAPAQQSPGYTVKNPYALLPTAVNFSRVDGDRPKSAVEVQYDAGLLFEILGQTNGTFKLIADELLGAKRGRSS
jgi:hypothetical protein